MFKKNSTVFIYTTIQKQLHKKNKWYIFRILFNRMFGNINLKMEIIFVY